MKVFVGFVFLCVLGFGLAQVGAPPQKGDVASVDPVSIEFDNEEVVTALTKVLRSYGVNYSFSPSLKGRVTVSLRNVTLIDALLAILRAASASCKIENGIYYITPPAEFGAARRIRINGGPHPSFIVLHIPPVEHLLADQHFLYTAWGQMVWKLRKKDLSVVAFRGLGITPTEKPSGLMIDKLSLSQVDIRTALSTLFKRVNVSYSIAPDLYGNVSAHVINAPLEPVLQEILNQVGGAYRVEGGVYQCINRSSATMYDPPQIKHMIMDGTDLFVSIGPRILRLSKKDLSVVSERNLLFTSQGVSETPGIVVRPPSTESR